MRSHTEEAFASATDSSIRNTHDRKRQDEISTTRCRGKWNRTLKSISVFLFSIFYELRWIVYFAILLRIKCIRIWKITVVQDPSDGSEFSNWF